MQKKGPSSQGYGFSSSHVWMWELDYKKSWAPKNRCFWTVVLEKTLESPLDCKEIQPINHKGNQPWIFIGRTEAEAETPYFGHLMWRTDSLEKTLMLGKIEGRRRRGRQRMSQLFAWSGQSIGVSALASVLPMNIRDWFPLWLIGWISLQSTGLSITFFNTIVKKHQFFGAQLFLESNSHIRAWLLEKP